MKLDAEDIEAVARRVVSLMREMPSVKNDEVLTRAEAKVYVKRFSEGAFSDWCKLWRIKPHRRGRYSRTHLDVALSQESRRRAA